jgi:putative ABC transport system permease protein
MNAVLRKFRRKSLRTFLTLLQIVLGALAMTLALSAYLDAVQRQNAGQAGRFDLMAGYVDTENNNSRSYNMLEQGDLTRFLELTPDIEKAALFMPAWDVTVERDRKLYQFIGGSQAGGFVDEVYFDLIGLEPSRGSFFTKQDAETKNAVAVMSDESAKIIFGDTDPVGQTFQLMPDENTISYDEDGNPSTLGSPISYSVIGTFADKVGAKTDAWNQTYIYLPVWKTREFTYADTVVILAKEGKGDVAREQAIAAARSAFKEELKEQGAEEGKDFYIREIGQDIWNQNTSNLLDPTVVMFGLFGIVALIVGSIGIFSIMLVDALERERDTGIKRALGATRARITREMTLEATLIAGLGGLIGVLLAALIIPVLVQQVGNTLFWNVSLRWQPVAALIVFGLTLLLGTVLGFFPALRAARVNPVEALKGV